MDAHSGAILLNFSQLTEAKNRAVFNMNHDQTNANLPGVLVRSEGQGPVADADANQAYDFAGQTYDYYFANHGRDSFDNAGGQLQSSVHFGTGFQNAFWNGSQMVYGDGFTAADDVVAHELTHAVTERSANLLYYYQSGALNESFSDIFGETLDLTNGAGNDSGAVRWQLAEDLSSIGPIRNMMTPTDFGNPGKMSDSEFVCHSDGWTGSSSDSGGVHSNSGVPNHAFALMVDGGSYNGRTVTGIGLTKAAKIQYRALTTYLTSGSTFADNANALNQSCSDLDRHARHHQRGLHAGEQRNPGGRDDEPVAMRRGHAAACHLLPDRRQPRGALRGWIRVGRRELDVVVHHRGQLDGFRYRLREDWRCGWRMAPDVASHVRSPPGDDECCDAASQRAHVDSITRSSSSTRAARRSSTAASLEYSTNGTTWNDAGSLIDAGQAYNGTLVSGNDRLGSRTAFVRSSFGYTATRLNLASSRRAVGALPIPGRHRRLRRIAWAGPWTTSGFTRAAQPRPRRSPSTTPIRRRSRRHSRSRHRACCPMTTATAAAL